MKKILLTCAVAAMTIFATEAQTKKSTSKKSSKKSVNSEARLNSDIAKIKAEKSKAMEEQRLERLMIDSTRREDERLAELQKDSLRMAWKQQKMNEVDSLNSVKWKKQITDKDDEYAAERTQAQLAKAAKLSTNQGRQVKAINMSYNDKAQLVMLDSTLSPESRKQQLTALNTERRAKIKEIVGKNKEKNLEKERIKYSAKNSDDRLSAWLNEVAVNK